MSGLLEKVSDGIDSLGLSFGRVLFITLALVSIVIFAIL